MDNTAFRFSRFRASALMHLRTLALAHFFLLPLASPALTFGDYTYIVTDNKATITYFNASYSGALSITNSLGGYPVKSIGQLAFSSCTSLTSVTIPDSVTSIGDGAFSDCSTLTAISVHPDNPAYASLNGVLYDKSLATLILFPSAFPGHFTIPDNVKAIGESAFYNCEFLTSVTIPGSVASIGDHAFAGCTSLTSVTIGAGVTSIGRYAFAWCSSLTSVTIPGSVNTIGYGAFRTCTSLAFVLIPDSVLAIGAKAFAGCSGLTGVTIPDSVLSIGDSAFDSCGNLGTVTIGNGVTRIGHYAFSDCDALTLLVIPAQVRWLGWQMLGGCDTLNAVTFEGSYQVEGTEGDFYGWDGGSGAVTSYVYAAHTTSWEPQVQEGPLAEGQAVWQTRPIRVLANPVSGLTVTLDKRGGAFLGPSSKTVTYGNAYGSLPAPTRAGHVFDGWWTGINGGGMSVFPTSMVSCARNHTLYAKWLTDVTAVAASALGTTNLVWLTGGCPLDWRVDETASIDGNGSLRSAEGQPDGTRSVLQTRLTGPGVLQFHWRVPTENEYNFLRFFLDGSERVDSISGEDGWTKMTVNIPSGEHVLEWVNEKDGSGYDGSDSGWLDRVVWPAVPQTPEANFWLWEGALFGSSWLPDYLFAARDGFTARIETTPNDVTSRVYRAVTSIASLSENAELRTLTGAFGLSLDTNLFTAAGAFTGTNAPPCNEAVDRAAAQLLPTLDAALADLEAIPSDWSGAVEIAAVDSGFDETVSVDLADVLLLKSALYAARAAVRVAQAYDLTADYAKTNVIEWCPAPFELPVISDPFTDTGFTAWESVPAYLHIEPNTYVDPIGLFKYAKFARTETEALLFLQAADGSPVDFVYAELIGANGDRVNFWNIDVSGAVEGEQTVCWGYEWVIVPADPGCPECGGLEEAVEVAFTVLKSGGSILIARDAEWGVEPFQVSEAYASIDSGGAWDGTEWQSDSRVQSVPRFLEDHPDFFKTVRDTEKLPLAKESLRSALLAAQAADTSITGRTGEAWHFIEFAPDQTNWMAEVRQKLAETLASLDAPQSIRFCHTNVEEIVNGYWDEFYDEEYGYYYDYVVTSVETQRTEVINRTESIHLGAAFAPPHLTRALLPRFSYENAIVLGTFADPTFGGVLPEWTTPDVETNLLGRVPVMRERAFKMGGQWFHTGGHALWSCIEDEGWGELAMGGEVRRQGKVSWVETTVTGPGTLDFSWGLTEAENRGSSLAIHVDGITPLGGDIWGDTGWVPRQITIPEGRHTVRWTYTLQYDWTADETEDASLGWLTDFLWVPEFDRTSTTPVEVPYAWLDGYPALFSTDDDYESVALADKDGDGQATWEEYVGGTHPDDPASVFKALIFKNGVGVEIGWTPDLTPARDYTVEGKADLSDEPWGSTNSATRFYRVKVSMP